MDETTDTTTGSSGWESWFQQIGGQVITAAADASYRQPYEIQRMRIQALGEQGYYTEGKPGVMQAPTGISPLMLMGGAALLLIVLLTRKA